MREDDDVVGEGGRRLVQVKTVLSLVDEIMFLNGEAFGGLEVFDAIAVGPLTMGEKEEFLGELARPDLS